MVIKKVLKKRQSFPNKTSSFYSSFFLESLQKQKVISFYTFTNSNLVKIKYQIIFFSKILNPIGIVRKQTKFF